METVHGEHAAMTLRVIILFVFLFIVSRADLHGQVRLTGEEVLRRVEAQLATVQDYVVELEAHVDMERLRMPPMEATMYFKKPDKVHFEAPGFAMLPREGIVLNPTWLRENFDATLSGEDTVRGERAYKLLLLAKEANVRVRQANVWIDPKTWTVTKLETMPYQGRTVAVVFTHAMVEGGVWLPQEFVADLGLAAPQVDNSFRLNTPYTPQINEAQRPPRTGKVTVRYSNYRVNVGLRDELFERKE
jgi:outer membrane lipoprotein-sorting protein